jgi:hypothetical protein
MPGKKENEPAKHFLQLDDERTAKADEYVPELHRSHPLWLAYCPATQDVWFGGEMTSHGIETPTPVEWVPTEQLMQAAACDSMPVPVP